MTIISCCSTWLYSGYTEHISSEITAFLTKSFLTLKNLLFCLEGSGEPGGQVEEEQSCPWQICMSPWVECSPLEVTPLCCSCSASILIGGSRNWVSVSSGSKLIENFVYTGHRGCTGAVVGEPQRGPRPQFCSQVLPPRLLRSTETRQGFHKYRAR